MYRPLAAASIILALFAFGCGDDDNGPSGPGNNTGSGPMSATIDGAAWAASSGAVQVTGTTSSTPQGTIVISGINISSGIGITLVLSYISGPGTYPLGVNAGTNAGGTGSVIDAPASWLTPLSGAAGTITITTRTSTHVAGTFQFTAEPIVGGGADVVVTSGQFDVTSSNTLLLPAGSPSSMSATLNGNAWNGATVVGLAAGPSVGGTTTEYSINLTPKTTIAAGGTYKIGSQMGATVVRQGTSDSWAVTVEDSVGYVTFTTLTAGRAGGSFAATLPQFGTATTPMVVQNGAFSVALN